MKNKKLEEYKEVFNEYLHNKNDVFNGDEKYKYKWYLNLEDIIFGYLGVNCSVHNNTDELRNFPTYLYESSYHCSEDEAKAMLNEIAGFIDEVKVEYFELRKLLSISNYEKSLIYKSTYFNIIDGNNYDSISLVDITITNDTNAYYEVSESDSYTMKKTLKDKEKYFERAIGNFKKEDLKFNINKNHISKLTILEDSENKEYTVKEFEKKYGCLNNFIYKELNHLTIKNDDPIINKAIELISNFINARVMTDIFFVEELPFSCSRNAIGKYDFGDIYITTKRTRTSKLEILIHEIGHYIHEVYFNEKQFRFSTKNKGKYAGKNYRENFAECFTDLIYYRKDNERTRKMMKILDEIV